MPPPKENAPQIDVRLYIGMVFFRWKTIVVCLLYSLLGGVLYVNLTPPEYGAYAAIRVYREPLINVVGAGSQWVSPQMHAQMLSNPNLHNRVIDRLFGEWGEKLGGRAAMRIKITARAGGQRVGIQAQSRNREYAAAFLDMLVKEHEADWQSQQRQAMGEGRELLERELAVMDEKIKESQNEVIEFRRLNDMTRQAVRQAVEDSFVRGVIARRRRLETQLMMMETQYPELKDANVAVIGQVDALTRAIVDDGSDAAVPAVLPEGVAPEGGDDAWLRDALGANSGAAAPGEAGDDGTGWPGLRLELARLKQQRAELARMFTPEHPRLREIETRIEQVQKRLDVAAELRLANLRDQYKSMQILLKALETVEYKWQARELQTLQREAELSRIQARVSRYEGNYNTLFQRLHDMRVADEMKTERFEIVAPTQAAVKPTWPDPAKVLLVALVIGLGSGFGIALTLQFLDNRVQSIKDVEQDLGLTFLGGVPFWVHSGLEKAIRPIVTEEHSTGAIEAYRALRTTLSTALAKENEKTIFVTSADAREGKTLTALNLAIMFAQMGKRILLIDMDLRRGRLHRSLGLEREPGVSDALKDGRSLHDIIQPTRVEHLDLAPTGRSIDDSAELLHASNLVGMLVELQDAYDYIIVDTSPVLRVTDTVILATQGIGVTVYIARVNHTPKPLIRYSLDMLKDAHILGLIMNSIEMHKISSLYYAYQYPNYAYYSNAYAYGYNYYSYDQQARRRRRGTSRRGGGGRGLVAAAGDWFRRTFLPME